MRNIVVILILVFSISPLLAKEFTFSLDILISGLKSQTKASAIVQMYTSYKFAPYTVTIKNSERNANGHFKKSIETPFSGENIEVIYIVGELKNQKNERIGYIPLQVLKRSDFSPKRLFARKHFRSVLNRERAFLASYPFSSDFVSGFIDKDNLNQVLNATQILIAHKFVEGRSWQDLFNSYLRNVSYFRTDNTKIEDMLAFLRTYGSLRDSPNFFSFYSDMLIKLDQLGMGGTKLKSGKFLKDYIFSELRTVITQQTSRSIPKFRSIIKLLRDGRRYSDCISLSTTMFRSIRSKENLLLEISKGTSGSTRRYVLSAMQGATECLQLDFANGDPNGNRKNKLQATKYQFEHGGDTFIKEFVGLYEDLQKHGNVFPRRPKNTNNASRLTEISSYYTSFFKYLDNRVSENSYDK